MKWNFLIFLVIFAILAVTTVMADPYCQRTLENDMKYICGKRKKGLRICKFLLSRFICILATAISQDLINACCHQTCSQSTLSRYC